jgi:hypothetical protein
MRIAPTLPARHDARRGVLLLFALFAIVLLAVLTVPASRAYASVCGDGVTEAPEQCDGMDDGACPGLCLEPGGPNECRCPVCGDGEQNQDTEECDGNDGQCPGECLPSCLCPGCGNNVTEAPETCDGTDDAACPGLCTPPGSAALECRCPVCGDGELNGNEECDGSIAPTCPDKCLSDCTCATCGDNVVESPAETCDGTDDSACPGLCPGPGENFECRCPFCGDGVINVAGEVCDRHDDAACPGHCSYACTCAVCGDDLSERPVETCDGTDDVACPGLCFPPGDPHECVCPLTLNKCAVGKQKCVVKKVAGLLKCYVAASFHGSGAADPICLQKIVTKFEGTTPPRGCFEKLELPSHCFTEDDTDAMETQVDAFIDALVLQLDPNYPAAVPDRCGAAKKKCATTFLAGLFSCRQKAEAKNLALDPLCIQKYTDRFDGGANPADGCFEKVEAKTTCQTVDDAPVVAGMVNAFVQDVVCDLDPYRPECP